MNSQYLHMLLDIYETVSKQCCLTIPKKSEFQMQQYKNLRGRLHSIDSQVLLVNSDDSNHKTPYDLSFT